METEPESDAKQRARDSWLADDLEQALGLLRPLAQAGDPEAQLDLGEILLRTPGDETLGEALGWIESAAEAGDVTAAYRLAGLYRETSPVCRCPDEAKAQRWCSVSYDAFRPRAEAGDPAAQFALANLSGYFGFEILDGASTLEWYTRAAEQGLAPAIAVVSVYHTAEGNLELARHWQARARALGCAWPSLAELGFKSSTDPSDGRD